MVLYRDLGQCEIGVLSRGVFAMECRCANHSGVGHVGLVVGDEPSMESDRVLYMSSRWVEHEVVLSESMVRVEQPRQAFRFPRSDKTPLQVRSLPIGILPRERYHPTVCVIGARAGFIEAAACIGIPVFYSINDGGGIGGGTPRSERRLFQRRDEEGRQ